MAINEMDARLISQAEQVTSAEGTALVPISTEAGQPQKNISLADMADSMGAQASEVADIKTLWGQTSDGQMVQINKASIASVLGNLLYGADTKEELATVVAEQIGSPVGTKQTNAADDCNNILKNGIYPFSALPANAPSGASTGALICFASTPIKVQLYITDVNTKMYYRKRWYEDDWSGWNLLATS